MNLARVNDKGIPEFDKKRDLILAKDEETGERFFLSYIETSSDYHWQKSCLEDRLRHPEIYAETEDVEAVIERLKKWLEEHKAEKPKEEPRYRMETWKEINGFAGEYFVSDLGRVKNKYEEIIKPRIQHNIAKVLLFKNNRVAQRDVFVLVAEAFLEKPYQPCLLTPIDGDYTNARLENLEYKIIRAV